MLIWAAFCFVIAALMIGGLYMWARKGPDA